nr:MAG TPA: hypothetical protein [Bacteriophage sp.]
MQKSDTSFCVAESSVPWSIESIPATYRFLNGSFPSNCGSS